MPVVVRDLVPAFLAFWQEAAAVGEQQRLELWREYAASNPDAVNDVARWGGDPEPAQALARYPALLPRITANAGRAAHWIAEAADLVSPVLRAGHLDVPCVSLVGLAKSNGWVSVVDGEHTLFLAIEQVPDEVAAKILTAHEMAHALQLPLPDPPWPEDGPLGHGIYAEGFATALTAELTPSFSLAEHLWFGSGHEGRLAECERALPAARAEILRHLDSGERAVQRRYLNLNSGYHLPERIGYLVGVLAVRELRRDHDWPALARWSPQRAMAELRRVPAP